MCPLVPSRHIEWLKPCGFSRLIQLRWNPGWVEGRNKDSEIWSLELSTPSWCGPSWPLLSHVGMVPVHSCDRVQVLFAEPDRVNPPRQAKLCMVPGRNHWSLGQKSPLSSWSWAGHSFSGGGGVQRESGRHYNTYESHLPWPTAILTFTCCPWHSSAIGWYHGWPVPIGLT